MSKGRKSFKIKRSQGLPKTMKTRKKRKRGFLTLKKLSRACRRRLTRSRSRQQRNSATCTSIKSYMARYTTVTYLLPNSSRALKELP